MFVGGGNHDFVSLERRQRGKKRQKERLARRLLSLISLFSFLFRAFFNFFSRRSGRQLSAGPVGRGQAPVDPVEAERDRVEPLAWRHERRVERRDDDLSRGRHDDAADARGRKAVAREQLVEVAHRALDEQRARQHRLLLDGRGLRREELLVLLDDGDGGLQRLLLCCGQACSFRSAAEKTVELKYLFQVFLFFFF